jgi:hypothetical protein
VEGKAPPVSVESKRHAAPETVRAAAESKTEQATPSDRERVAPGPLESKRAAETQDGPKAPPYAPDSFDWAAPERRSERQRAWLVCWLSDSFRLPRGVARLVFDYSAELVVLDSVSAVPLGRPGSVCFDAVAREWLIVDRWNFALACFSEAGQHLRTVSLQWEQPLDSSAQPRFLALLLRSVLVLPSGDLLIATADSHRLFLLPRWL